MMELSPLWWALAFFFTFVGWSRGWTKEIISMAGIVLGLFATFQFDTLIRLNLLGNVPPDQRTVIQVILFLIIVFFAYQTRAIVGGEAQRTRRGAGGRDPLQTKVLGAMAGFVNGYLVGGTLWYFLEINRLPSGQYPLSPYITAPLPGTPSAEAVSNLPLFILTQNGANGDLLSLLVVLLFLLVLVLI